MSEELAYMTLADWVLHNLRIYGSRNGFDNPAMNNALVFLSSYAWDQLMLAEVKGKRFVEHLIEQCIDNPFTRDEEEWDSYMECVAEKLEPFVNELKDVLQDLHRKIREAARSAMR